ncbi:MAG TPA: hypothetical protein VKU60_10620 [Chloroflexota bacterium]|nr:hypothetical protein [Chloroflexota bacterium]
MPDEIVISQPWLRCDMTMPLFEGRISIDGVKLVPSPPMSSIVASQDLPEMTASTR